MRPAGAGLRSLPAETPRPGPELLYRDAPRAPQLENTGSWKAKPIMVSGASAYRAGEFLYQDYLYDESSLEYPAQPEVYADNAADLVEVRVKLLAHSFALRLTYNTMLDPGISATTIALGSSTGALAMPHDAGASMPAELFVTVHGCTGDIVAAKDGQTLATKPAVKVDLTRRQVEVQVPYTTFDPRGKTDVRIGAATGLWDAAAGKYQRPDSSKPAFFNVAFRYDEPMTQTDTFGLSTGLWNNTRQNAALNTGDLSPFAASVDFTKLANNVNDDMPDQAQGVPQSGKFNRIYASYFETAQGRGNFPSNLLSGGTEFPAYQPCHAPECAPPLAGQLQPYSVYIPPTAQPAAGWGTTFFHHGTTENHNSFIERASRFADLASGSIAIGTEARGPDIWEYEQAAADLYEVWADIARTYKLDPERSTLSGVSLGGHATWKHAVQFPDLWAAVAPHIGPTAPQGMYLGPLTPPASGEGSLIYPLLPSLRHVPVAYWVGQQDELVPWTGTAPSAEKLNDLGYRHQYRAFAGDHLTTGGLLASYDDEGNYLAKRTVERTPAHVTYVYNDFMDQPEYGLNSDHAYWISAITLRDTTGPAPRGTIDAFTKGLGKGDAPVGPTQLTAGAPASLLAVPLPYIGHDLAWGTVPTTPKQDTLTVTTTNINSLTINPARAGLSCNPTIALKSDGPVSITLTGCAKTVTVTPTP
ncbi:hypothetical protein [Pseudarthrobacter scleromae]|uniref:hypothetical protein n=1 Tax=Pseudarthrobacter scleromae TaxID=158897 RepID=UPI003CFD53AB